MSYSCCYITLFVIEGSDVAPIFLFGFVVIDDAEFETRFEGSSVNGIRQETMTITSFIVPANVL